MTDILVWFLGGVMVGAILANISHKLDGYGGHSYEWWRGWDARYDNWIAEQEHKYHD